MLNLLIGIGPSGGCNHIACSAMPELPQVVFTAQADSWDRNEM